MERDETSHNRLLSVFNHAPIAIALCGLNGHFLVVNCEFSNFTGYTDIELASKSFLDITYPNDNTASVDYIKKIYQGQRTNFQIEKRYLTKNGEIKWGRTVVSAIKNEMGELVETFAMIQDISVERMTRDLLLAREQEYKKLVELMFNGIMLVEHFLDKKTIIDANKSLSEIFGYDFVSDILGKDLSELFDITSIQKIDNIRSQGLFEKTHQMSATSKNGESLVVDFLSRNTEFNGKNVCLVAIRDKTDEIKTYQKLQESQNQIFQSQKMWAIGRFSSGIAHDFKNILLIVSGYCDIISSEIQTNREEFKEISEALAKGLRLTQQLQNIGKKQSQQTEQINLNHEVMKIIPLLQRITLKQIRIKTDLDPAISRVHWERSKIEQIILNLLINAIDAIDSSGEIVVSTSIIKKHKINPKPKSDTKEYAQLSVSDTGRGIGQETMNKIFEPFYSTKVKNGTGLGLAIVQSIVDQQEGVITVESELGKGSTFNVFLKYQLEEI